MFSIIIQIMWIYSFNVSFSVLFFKMENLVPQVLDLEFCLFGEECHLYFYYWIRHYCIYVYGSGLYIICEYVCIYDINEILLPCDL